ncbi:MAG: hypothetical protein JST26_01215 [Bacteroidetes bacterium]|nr:hypothetical protein [Bacteroidota bacterium]
MKYLWLILPFILLASCRKSYTCTCTVDGNSITGGSVVVKGTKKNARKTCDDYEANFKSYGSGVDCFLQ